MKKIAGLSMALAIFSSAPSYAASAAVRPAAATSQAGGAGVKKSGSLIPYFVIGAVGATAIIIAATDGKKNKAVSRG